MNVPPGPLVPESWAGVQRGQRAPCDLTLQSAPFASLLPGEGARVTELCLRGGCLCTPTPPRLCAPSTARQGLQAWVWSSAAPLAAGRRGSVSAQCWGVQSCERQTALAEDAVLELLWGWPFLPSWPAGFHPLWHEPWGCSSSPHHPRAL